MGKQLHWEHVLNTHELVGGDFDETAKMFLSSEHNSVDYARYKKVLGGFHRFAPADIKAKLVALMKKNISSNARMNRTIELLRPYIADINEKRNADNFRREVYFDQRMGALNERPTKESNERIEREREAREEARLRKRAPNESPKLYRKRLRRQGA